MCLLTTPPPQPPTRTHTLTLYELHAFDHAPLDIYYRVRPDTSAARMQAGLPNRHAIVFYYAYVYTLRMLFGLDERSGPLPEGILRTETACTTHVRRA